MDRVREGFGDLGPSVADDDAESFARTGMMFARMRESLGLTTQTDLPRRGPSDNVKLSYWVDDDPPPRRERRPSTAPYDSEPEVETELRAEFGPEFEQEFGPEFEQGFRIAADDVVYISGTPATISTYYDTFAGTRAA